MLASYRLPDHCTAPANLKVGRPLLQMTRSPAIPHTPFADSPIWCNVVNYLRLIHEEDAGTWEKHAKRAGSPGVDQFSA